MSRAEFYGQSQSAERAERDDVLARAQRKLEEITVRQKDKEIDPNQFRGLGDDYSDSIVDNDLDDLEELEKEFAEIAKLRTGEAEVIGKIFEQIVLEQFGKWIADNVSVRKASRFDDCKNGVDAIAEIKEPSETNYLALALDATHGNSVTNKLTRIKEQIEKGKMSEVKYYQSLDGSFRGKLKRIPRVVIGADRNKVMELAALWVEGKEDELSNHPVQFQVLEEIILQLETYANYAQSLGKAKVAENYRKQLAIFKKYQEEKMKIKETPENYHRSGDRSFMAIQDTIKNFTNLKTRR